MRFKDKEITKLEEKEFSKEAKFDLENEGDFYERIEEILNS